MGSAGAMADILIVDNDERIVELVAWFLAKRGYQVRSAPSFSAARRLLLDRVPDLMLSDVDLGTESALEELPRLGETSQLPRTLVVSGYLDAPTVERLRALPHVVGTLSKPFDFGDLEREVRRGLDAPRPGAAADRAGQPGSEDATGAPEADAGDGWIEITARPPSAHATR